MGRPRCKYSGSPAAGNGGIRGDVGRRHLDGRTATVEDEHGTLNPQELTTDFFIRQAGRKAFDPHMCMYGYFVAKWATTPARARSSTVAHRRRPGPMPWAAWEAENGFDKPSDPVKAAEWDRRTAKAGYSVGELNYGLDLLRGHGVALAKALAVT